MSLRVPFLAAGVWARRRLRGGADFFEDKIERVDVGFVARETAAEGEAGIDGFFLRRLSMACRSPWFGTSVLLVSTAPVLGEMSESFNQRSMALFS